jgi:3-hydroxybutyryl-CoA dehydrogenase
MHIVVIGNESAFAECQAKFGDEHHYNCYATLPTLKSWNDRETVIFDFNCDWTKEQLNFYTSVKETPIFLNSVFTTLAGLRKKGNLPSIVIGFCGLPTFFNRSILEVTWSNPADQLILSQVAAVLKTEFKVVKDQVGMVTPRVIAMIINEAYEALQQQVASREDIDLSMKLGTNYPFGPFEWADKIELSNVKKLLNALENATGDSRYRCNL